MPGIDAHDLFRTPMSALPGYSSGIMVDSAGAGFAALIRLGEGLANVGQVRGAIPRTTMAKARDAAARRNAQQPTASTTAHHAPTTHS